MLTISSDVSILGRQRQPPSGLLWAYCNPPVTSPGKLPLLISNSSAGFEPTTSRLAGRILGDPRAVSQVGRKGGTKVFKYGRKSPWVPTLTELFPNIQADAGSWLGTKNALYYCAQSANSFSWVLSVSSYTKAIVLSHLHGSFTKLVRARETFIFYFPNQKRRNYRWVEKTFGMLSAGAIQFAPRIFCFWRITMYRK